MHKPSPREFTGQRWDWLKLIFIALVPGICAWQWKCAFKATKARAGKKKGRKNIFPWIICLTPPVLWNIKEHLPVRSSREECQSSACPLWCALKSARIGRCNPPLFPVPHAALPLSRHHPSLHTAKASEPSAFCANTLSIQLATPQMAKFSTLYYPCGLFLHKAVCHIQQHTKGVNW